MSLPDADWLGLSILSGAHMTLVPRVLELLREAKLEQVKILVGGIIPEADIARLLELGVARVFGPGTSLDEIVAFLRAGAEHATQLQRCSLEHYAFEQLGWRFEAGCRKLLASSEGVARGRGPNAIQTSRVNDANAARGSLLVRNVHKRIAGSA